MFEKQTGCTPREGLGNPPKNDGFLRRARPCLKAYTCRSTCRSSCYQQEVKNKKKRKHRSLHQLGLALILRDIKTLTISMCERCRGWAHLFWCLYSVPCLRVLSKKSREFFFLVGVCVCVCFFLTYIPMFRFGSSRCPALCPVPFNPRVFQPPPPATRNNATPIYSVCSGTWKASTSRPPARLNKKSTRYICPIEMDDEKVDRVHAV